MEERIRERGAIFNHGNTKYPDSIDAIHFRLPDVPCEGAKERQDSGGTGKKQKNWEYHVQMILTTKPYVCLLPTQRSKKIRVCSHGYVTCNFCLFS
jgi:hypothetical protein